jgi:excisionase family DNA binding protein
MFNQTDKLLTRKEAAQFLGLAESTLSNWACTKRVVIPTIRLGRSVRYRLSDLNHYIENSKI